MTDRHREQITELVRTIVNFPTTHPIVLNFFLTYLMEGHADGEIVTGLTRAQGGSLRHALKDACQPALSIAERTARIAQLGSCVDRYMKSRCDIPYDTLD